MRAAVRVASMSTSENIPLHLKEDGNDTRRTEQLEHGDTTDIKHGTLPSAKGSAAAAAPAATTTRWKTVMITVTTLLCF